MKLTRSFYLSPTVEVAGDLLGKFLVHKTADKVYEGQIIETEAYCGPDDLACHGARGRTKRNEVLFQEGGHAYVYLIYGVYYCLNITTEKEGYPSAVLIRALDYPGCDGPGELCREFKITRPTHNGIDVTGDLLWVEDRGLRPRIARGKRIGVEYAKHCAEYPWRFFVKGLGAAFAKAANKR